MLRNIVKCFFCVCINFPIKILLFLYIIHKLSNVKIDPAHHCPEGHKSLGHSLSVNNCKVRMLFLILHDCITILTTSRNSLNPGTLFSNSDTSLVILRFTPHTVSWRSRIVRLELAGREKSLPKEVSSSQIPDRLDVSRSVI